MAGGEATRPRRPPERPLNAPDNVGWAVAPPRIMGIVNVTPDSFSDGGRYDDVGRAVAHACALLDDGADLVDIGGESTRPGAAPVSAEEEGERAVPVVAALRRERPDAVISIDTRRASVAEAALEQGATIVNDVSAGADPAMASVVAARPDVCWVLMHMRGVPATMQHHTHYSDLVGDVERYLADRVAVAVAAGVARSQLWVDPGLGFGKAPGDNPALVRAVPRLVASLGLPVLIGASRKRFVGELTGVSQAAERVHGSVGVALAAALHGASVLRVHDVAATRQALMAFEACR